MGSGKHVVAGPEGVDSDTGEKRWNIVKGLFSEWNAELWMWMQRRKDRKDDELNFVGKIKDQGVVPQSQTHSMELSQGIKENNFNAH